MPPATAGSSRAVPASGRGGPRHAPAGGLGEALDGPALLVPLPEGSAVRAALSKSQSHLLRRVRRMYIEKVMQTSDRVAYDERVDMRPGAAHPRAELANVMAHLATACFWAVAMMLSCVYGIRFRSATATSWFYSCASGWIFVCCILDVVKVLLSTMLEISEFNQRQRLRDHTRIEDKVSLRRAIKLTQMSALAGATGKPVTKVIAPLLPPPLPLQPPPALGDASAG